MNMRTASAVILAVSFAGLGVLGFSILNHGVLEHNGCLAVTLNGAFCPNNVFSFVFFHLNAFKFFSTAVFHNNVLSFMLALAALAFAIAPERFYAGQKTGLAAFRLEQNPEPVASSKRKLINWLSLKENSPALL